MTRSFLATVGVMALACQSAGAKANQQGQPGTGTETEQAAALPEPAEEGSGIIVVTASRTGTPLEKLPTSVSVIDEQELSEQLSFSTNIVRAIEFAVPGLSPQGEGRSSCNLNIRGRQTSVQVNGIPITQDLRQGSCTEPYLISPFAVERIEVVRGGTALYGAGAPGGIINLVTRRAKGRDLEIDAVAQTSFNTSDWDETFTTDLYVGAGQDLGAWDYYVGAGYTDAGAQRTPDAGFVPFREYDSISLNGAVGLDLAGGELRVTGTYFREEPGQEYASDGSEIFGEQFGNVIPIDSHPQVDEAFDRLTTLAVAYRHPQFLGHELNVSGFYQEQKRKQRDNFFFFDFGNDFFASDFEDGRLGFRSTLVKRFNLGSTEIVGSYGFDYTRNRVYRPVIDPAADGEIIGYVAPETILRTYALFGQAEVEFGRFRLTGGVRQEWYRGEVGEEGFDPTLPNASTPGDFGKSDLTLFNIGGVFEVTPDIQIYAGFSQGAELSELGRAARGIDDPGRITPEPATSDQYEAGIRGQAGPLRFEVGGFYSESDSAALLQPDPSCEGEPLCPLIPLRTPSEFHGFEASADWTVTKQLNLSGVVTWQRGKAFNEDLDEFVNYSTDFVAPFRVTGAVSWRPLDPLRLSLQGTYYGAANYFTPTEQEFGFVNTEEQFLLDGSVHYRIGPGELYLAASNLLDDEYVNVANQGSGFFYYQAQGRRVTLGYKARF